MKGILYKVPTFVQTFFTCRKLIKVRPTGQTPIPRTIKRTQTNSDGPKRTKTDSPGSKFQSKLS